MQLKELPENTGFHGKLFLKLKEKLEEGRRQWQGNDIITAIAEDAAGDECYFHFWNEQIPNVYDKLNPGDIFCVYNGFCKGLYNDKKDISTGRFGKVWIVKNE